MDTHNMCAKFHCILKSACTFRHFCRKHVYFAKYNHRVKPEFVLTLTLTPRLEFVLIYPGIRFVDPQSVDQQGSDICGRELSTFNIIFNLLVISLAKIRIKEPASQSLSSTRAAVDCIQYKKPYNNKKSKAINFGRKRRHREG